MGLYIAAAITTAAVASLYGYVLYRMAAPTDRRIVLLAVLIALPLQPLAYFLVRLPLNGLVTAALGSGSLIGVIALFYAPLTEEPAKWLTLLVPRLRQALNPDNAVTLALAVGLGFGIGELWFIAYALHASPVYAALPFYAFGGFFVERILVCFIHGALISFAFHRLATGRSFLLGGLIGMALHFALNFPIFLAGADAFGLGPPVWQVVLTLWVPLFALGLGAAVTRLSGGRFRAALLGHSTCPECGTVYPRPLLALNFGPVRYERCPTCRHFHWVRV